MRTSALVVLTLAWLVPAAGLTAEDGQIARAYGSCQLVRAGQSAPAQVGMQVAAGDVLRTGADGSLLVVLARGVQIKLRAGSELRVGSTSGVVDVELLGGGLFSRVLRGTVAAYQVRLGTATCGVRGTEFFAAWGRAADAWMCVNEGQVAVERAGGGRTLVNAGEGVLLPAAGGVGAPRRYAWTRGLNWNMDPAKGDVVDRTDLDKAYGDLLRRHYD